jgi:hypothetical protein
MARDNAVDSAVVVFNNTTPVEANFGVKCKGVVLKPTAGCYIAFDRPANTGDFLIAATDSNIPLLVAPIEFTRISVLGSSGSGTMYLLVQR